MERSLGICGHPSMTRPPASARKISVSSDLSHRSVSLTAPSRSRPTSPVLPPEPAARPTRPSLRLGVVSQYRPPLDCRGASHGASLAANGKRVRCDFSQSRCIGRVSGRRSWRAPLSGQGCGARASVSALPAG
jgi:hypothetical protein